MKKLILLTLPILFFIISCEEIGPTIELQPTNRKVVIEEFTGVQCVNCPQGSEQIENLLNIHEDKLIAISIHSGQFSFPYDESKYDFRTDEGSDLEDYLGPPEGWPSAVVNRKWFPSQQNRVVFLNDWAGFIQQELQEEPKIRLDVNSAYVNDTREINVEVDIYSLDDITGITNLTVLITENEIKDYQLRPEGKDPEYSHKHVLRKVLSNNYQGDFLGEDIGEGVAISKNFNYTIPSEWNAEKCHIVVFVNQNDGNTLDILQADEIDVVQ